MILIRVDEQSRFHGAVTNLTMTRKNRNKQSNQAKKSQNTQKAPGKRSAGKRTNRVARMAALSQPTPQPTLGSIGGQLGTVAGNFLSKIFGLGAYTMQQNSVFDAMVADQVPAMHSSSETIIMRHREYLTDISSSVAFTTATFAVNPGLSTTFPFLSAIAQNFQEYEFRGLVFEFKSTSANALNSTNTALGTVMMAAQYQSDATGFLNKQQLLNEMWSVDAKPSESFMLPIECAPAENPFKVQYIRSGALSANKDQKMYDLCKLTVGTYGSQAVANIGELWCTYEVALRKPQLSQSLDLGGLAADFALTSPSNAAPLGTSRVQLFDQIGLTISNTTVTFPIGSEGTYLITAVYSNGTGVIVNFNIPVLTNCTFVTFAGGNYFGTNGTASSYAEITFIVTITDPTLVATVAFATSSVIPTSPAQSRLLIVQLPYGLAIAST